MKFVHKCLVPVCLIIMIAGFVIPLLPARAETNIGTPDTSAIDAYLQEYVSTNHIPGVAVAVVQGDKVLLEKGYGDSVSGKPVTPQTQFYIGSVTKSFTALAAMKLVEQGKLDLDAPVQKYLPEFKVDDPEASSRITVRNLLNHTSGLVEKGDPNASAYTASIEEQVTLMQYVKPTYPAGTHYEYYNQNYRIVGRVIEKVSGKSYGDFVKDSIFLPLGMTHTVTDPADTPNLAQGYSRFFSFPLPQTEKYIPGALPSGYLITTAEDMSKYVVALINNRQLDGKPVLREDLLAEMRTPPSGIESDYAMGWMSADDGDTLIHGGAIHHFQAFVGMKLKEKTGFVTLYNQNSMENMMFENSTVNSDLLNFLGGKSPRAANNAWPGLVLLFLALADMANHVRLFRMVPTWVERTARQSRIWLWIKVAFGMVVPLLIVFGLPVLVNLLEGASPDWIEPFHLMPDITIWLLAGSTLNFIRSLLHAISLFRKPETFEEEKK